jgi:hypothetical protein
MYYQNCIINYVVVTVDLALLETLFHLDNIEIFLIDSFYPKLFQILKYVKLNG